MRRFGLPRFTAPDSHPPAAKACSKQRRRLLELAPGLDPAALELAGGGERGAVELA